MVNFSAVYVCLLSHQEGYNQAPSKFCEKYYCIYRYICFNNFIFQTFYPLLKQAAGRLSNEPMSCSKAAIITVGSGQGSITENASSGMYPYRASKVSSTEHIYT